MTDTVVAQETKLKGIASSHGIAIGKVFIYQDISEYQFPQITSEEPKNEIEKLRTAVKKLLCDIKKVKEETEKSYGPKMADLFSLQIGLLEDSLLFKEIEDKITQEKITAAYSVYTVLSDKKKHFLKLDNDFFKDRVSEIQDTKKKLIYLLQNKPKTFLQDEPAIVIANDVSPSDTMKMYKNNVLAFVMETGGKSSHAAIMSRALDVPSVVGCPGIIPLVKNNDIIIVDGIKGEIIIHPTKETIARYKKQLKKFKSFEKSKSKTNLINTVTKDEEEVNIFANIEFVQELNIIKKYKANGIGLYRTESLFMNREALASEEEQFKNYLEIAEAMHPLPVTIRTLDVGGDKVLPDIYKNKEQNPFLGWRAVRFCLDNEEIFLAQLRAILRANIHGNIQLLVPMVSSLEEIISTKQKIEMAQKQLVESNTPFNAKLKLGIMIEIPSAVVMGDILADEVDFFSIGTNDLTQYTLAVDRGNQKIAKLYSPFHPAVIRLIKETIEVGKRNNTKVEMCGEMAGNHFAVPLLLGLGLRNFSMGHSVIPEIKQIVSSLSIKETKELAQKVLKLKTTTEIEEYLTQYFNKNYSQFVFFQGDNNEKSRQN